MQKDIHSCSDMIAENIGADKAMFEDKFLLFMSVIYYYCMTGDEENTQKQQYAIYEEVNLTIRKK